MRLPIDFSASLADLRGHQFDEDIAGRLADRYSSSVGRTRQDCVDWVKDRRCWLKRIGVVAQQHILDHLEVMIIHGNSVIDEPDYRAIMTKPFLSQDERASMLRHRYLPERDAEGKDE